jgi:nitrate reductase cytochrome c-type subunit
MGQCLFCLKLTKYSGSKYCSNKCQADYRHKEYIQKWKAGLVSGNRGTKAPLLSAHIKRYLVEKYIEKCCRCGWNQKHSVTGRVPLEANHIDGDPTNNDEANLELLCPNCHSLTENFRALNMGNGRAYRRKAGLLVV